MSNQSIKDYLKKMEGGQNPVFQEEMDMPDSQSNFSEDHSATQSQSFAELHYSSPSKNRIELEEEKEEISPSSPQSPPQNISLAIMIFSFLSFGLMGGFILYYAQAHPQKKSTLSSLLTDSRETSPDSNYIPPSHSPSTSPSSSNDQCQKAQSSKEKDQCHYMMAMRNRDEKPCAKIGQSDIRDVCYLTLANKLNHNQEKLCEKITNSTYKDNCYEALAEKESDIKWCRLTKHPTNQARCFARVGARNNNLQVCEAIKSPGTGTGTRNLCHLYLAKRTRNFTLCEKISDVGTKDACYYNIARETSNPQLCEKISTGSIYKSKCQQIKSRSTDNY